MNPQDDPEARIRDLERPLADRAYSSELGTQPYPAAGPYPPPPTYTMPPPYPTTQVKPRTSNTGVIVLVVSVLALLIVGASVAIYFANLGPRDGAVERPIAGGGGSIDFPSSVLPSGGAPVVVLPGGPAGSDDVVVQAPANGTFSVSGIEGNKRVACNDSNIAVSGVSNTVTITGHCVSVTVSGVENQVTVENTDVIGASGFDNRIVFQNGDPEITNSGGDNIVERG